MRGEYAGVAGTAVLVGELPPRARRIREHEATRGGEVGTTSACAENTGLIRVRFSPLRNYLRVRGEYESMILWSNICKELPPRARRIHPSDYAVLAAAGTTSACAENTRLSYGHLVLCGNYLRVRGEYLEDHCYDDGWGELPPRARRIPPRHAARHVFMGTTSACAENTAFPLINDAQPRNYLRVRGEYEDTPSKMVRLEELPPRARRIHTDTHACGARLGTTSACAENTDDLDTALVERGNYLRVRGEYRGRSFRLLKPKELPPRARRIRKLS